LASLRTAPVFLDLCGLNKGAHKSRKTGEAEDVQSD